MAARPSIHRAEVIGTRRLTPGMLRVTLGGDGLRAFTSTGVGDEYVHVLFPRPGEDEPALPADGESWLGEDDAAPGRHYTVRDHRAAVGEIDLDVVVHEGGVACAWALAAGPGDVVGVSAPRGLYDPPAGTTVRFLLADETGLPAVARLIEQAPPGIRTRAVVEVADRSHQLTIDHGGDTELTWVRAGNGRSPSRLPELVRTLELPDDGSGYVWVAGETKALREVRKHLRRERGLPAMAYRVVGYWTGEAEAWRARYDALPAEVRDGLARMWEDDRPADEIEDDYIARLESLGL